MQISQLRAQAAQKYMSIVSKPDTEPQIKTFCLQRARAQMLEAVKSRNEGSTAVMNMMNGIFGGQSLLPKASAQTPRIALASDEDMEREANKELEEYWNSLYKDSPGAEGYGTALEHAVELQGVPTEDIAPAKHKMRRHVPAVESV
jgi:hypothetical protein